VKKTIISRLKANETQRLGANTHAGMQWLAIQAAIGNAHNAEKLKLCRDCTVCEEIRLSLSFY